eukprot:UN32389
MDNITESNCPDYVFDIKLVRDKRFEKDSPPVRFIVYFGLKKNFLRKIMNIVEQEEQEIKNRMKKGSRKKRRSSWGKKSTKKKYDLPLTSLNLNLEKLLPDKRDAIWVEEIILKKERLIDKPGTEIPIQKYLKDICFDLEDREFAVVFSHHISFLTAISQFEISVFRGDGCRVIDNTNFSNCIEYAKNITMKEQFFVI